MLFSRYKVQFMPVGGFVFAVIGLVYSLVMSSGLGAGALCLTSGCSIVRDFKIFGLSPWWAASLLFAVIAALCLFRLRMPARILASLFLTGDCLFLSAMLLVAPCTSCLGAAFLIFCVWAGLRVDHAVFVTLRRVMAGALSAVWFILFILNLGHALNELLPQWQLAEQGTGTEKKISLYFSPSCPACREALLAFNGKAVFYPIAENDADYAVIADISARVAAGESVQAALTAIRAEQNAGSWTAPQLPLWRRTLNAVKLMRNQAAVLRQGYSTLPLIIFEGLPAEWAGAGAVSASRIPAEQQDLQTGRGTAAGTASSGQQNKTPENSGAASGVNGGTAPLPLDFGGTLECGRGAGSPCE